MSDSNEKIELPVVDQKDMLVLTSEAPTDVEGGSDYVETTRTRTSNIFTIFFAGFALLSDGYQAGVISFVNIFFAEIYGAAFTDTISTRISNSLFAGAVIGQIFFGIIIDRVGRKIGLLSTTALVIIGAALTAASSGATTDGLFWMFVISRGILGVGVGGEYPASSVSANEAADESFKEKRGLYFVMVTNFVIDFGFVLAAIIPAILYQIFGNAYAEPIWRLSCGIGIIFPLSVLYFRLKMLNTTRYRKESLKRKVPYLLILKRYWKRILATAGLWFLYDFISYPAGIFSGTILSYAIPDNSLAQTINWNILLNVFYLPGAVAGAYVIDRIGRKKTMALGFALQFIFGLITAIAYQQLVDNCFPVFIIMYGIYLTWGEFGPGDCIGLVSSELYPTAVRGQVYGISAAVGKIGALVGTQVFKPIVKAFGGSGTLNGQRSPFIIGTCLALLGAIITWYFIPDASKQGLEVEDREFREYLEQNGFDTSLFGEKDDESIKTEKTSQN